MKVHRVREAVAKGYFKVLAYKDEYEVARLHLETRKKAEEVFDGVDKITFHLAPPLLSKVGSDGRAIKRKFGNFVESVFPILAWFKFLRGTPLDVFSYTAERKMERALIRQYEQDMKKILQEIEPETEAIIAALAELPLTIRGFGVVKLENKQKAEIKRAELLNSLKYKVEKVDHAAE